jgi:hypothetical protein
MKMWKPVVLAMSLAISVSAFADGGAMGSGVGRGIMGSDSRIDTQDGGGTIGSGTRSGGYLGSGNLTSDDDGGILGSGGGKAAEEAGRGGLIGSGTRSDIMGSGYAAIVTDALGTEYLVVSDGASLTIVQLN